MNYSAQLKTQKSDGILSRLNHLYFYTGEALFLILVVSGLGGVYFWNNHKTQQQELAARIEDQREVSFILHRINTNPEFRERVLAYAENNPIDYRPCFAVTDYEKTAVEILKSTQQK